MYSVYKCSISICIVVWLKNISKAKVNFKDHTGLIADASAEDSSCTKSLSIFSM